MKKRVTRGSCFFLHSRACCPLKAQQRIISITLNHKKHVHTTYDFYCQFVFISTYFTLNMRVSVVYRYIAWGLHYVKCLWPFSAQRTWYVKTVKTEAASLSAFSILLSRLLQGSHTGEETETHRDKRTECVCVCVNVCELERERERERENNRGCLCFCHPKINRDFEQQQLKGWLQQLRKNAAQCTRTALSQNLLTLCPSCLPLEKCTGPETIT